MGRAAARRQESAVRVALGSSAGRLFRHLLMEGAALAVMGGILGIALAWWFSAALAPPANVWAPANFYGSLAPFDAPAFSLVELGFGLALVALTALLIAVPPALSAFRLDLSQGFRAGWRGMGGDPASRRGPSAGGLIVGVEAALA